MKTLKIISSDIVICILIHEPLIPYIVWYVLLPLRVQICLNGSGRPRLVITPSSWNFIFISGLCGGRPQSCWRCVRDFKKLFIPGIMLQSISAQLEHLVYLLWWGNGFSCLMVCEMNSHSSAAEEILHHRSQYGWVQPYVRVYSLLLLFSCSSKSIKTLLFTGGEIAALVSVSSPPCLYACHRRGCCCCHG